MTDQKLENMLNLALDATEAEREKSLQLNVGYDSLESQWEVIVKYSGNLGEVLGDEIPIVELLNGFAILTVPQSLIEGLTDYPQIEFIEKPKRLFFAVNQGKSASCMTSVQSQFSPLGMPLTGKGILVACVDSGIDYSHPDFRNQDGSTRILRLWDQSIPGNPPKGYVIGTEYTSEQINAALAAETKAERERIVPSRDLSGHGTGVMGIAVVKLGVSQEGGFPRTTELLQGIDYVLRQAVTLGKPVALNLSFGNNYGSHSGESLLESYLDRAANLGRSVICVGTGNEGNGALHTSGRLSQGENQEVALNVDAYEPS